MRGDVILALTSPGLLYYLFILSSSSPPSTRPKPFNSFPPTPRLCRGEVAGDDPSSFFRRSRGRNYRPVIGKQAPGVSFFTQ